MEKRKSVAVDQAVWQALAKLRIDRGDATLSDTIAWLLDGPRAAEPRRADPPRRPEPRVVVDPEHDQRRQDPPTTPPRSTPVHPDPGHASNNPRPPGDITRAGAIAKAVPGLMTGAELAKRQHGDI